MHRSTEPEASLPPANPALQHGPAPRPLPLFLELVRQAAVRDPDFARRALDGLAKYEQADRPPPRPMKPEAARIGTASLRDHGGTGAPLVLVPSLINPPDILDLDEDVSLASTLARMGRRVLLVDWGAAAGRSSLDVSGHVSQLLLPLLDTLGQPATLLGYCLGGTMAIAAAQLVPTEGLITLAAPWRFARYPKSSGDHLAAMWAEARPSAEQLGALPMEVLQAAFWSIDPDRTVAKFAEFARLEPDSPEARRFVTLEDWANRGEPLPCPAAAELLHDFFRDDRPGSGQWSVAGRRIAADAAVRTLHLIAERDRITPVETAAPGERVEIAAGHVGMIVGSARHALHASLARFLDPLVDLPRPR